MKSLKIKRRKFDLWTEDLEFVEKNIDLLLEQIGKCWNMSNEKVFTHIMDWSMPIGWYFPEALLSYFKTYKHYKDFWEKLKR